MPVVSLYLNTQADQHGRTNFDAFLRKEFARALESYDKRSSEYESLEKDLEKIQAWLQSDLRASANGVALFACSAKDFFEAVQLDAPVDENRLYIYHQPHLYTLARLFDQYPRYLAVIADTNSARVYTMGMRAVEDEKKIENVKTHRVQVGGWSQQRYQRHTENFHLHHVKELVDLLDRLTLEENIDKILVAGDEVVVPLLREQFTPRLQAMVVDFLKLDIRTKEQTVLEESLAAIRHLDAKTDQSKIDRMIGAWRAGGLAVTGVNDTMRALANGQVEELFLTVNLEHEHEEPKEMKSELLPHLAVVEGEEEAPKRRKVLVADELVTLARQTSAQVTFIEDPALLAGVGGVGATLRYLLPTDKRKGLQAQNGSTK